MNKREYVVHGAFFLIMAVMCLLVREIINAASIIIDKSNAAGDIVGLGVGALVLTVPTTLVMIFIAICYIALNIQLNEDDSDE